MLFCNKDLIRISGIYSRTYYRRLYELKESGEFVKTSKGYSMSYDEAKLLANKLNFSFKFDKEVKTLLEKNDRNIK